MKQSLIIAALVASASAFAPASVMPRATVLSAELGADWKETNFEADIEKLQKESEERLDAKIEELKANIASTGAAEN
ncbi:MAG: hypothetical protein SGBAC_009550 [Bacillariaceae sp.]